MTQVQMEHSGRQGFVVDAYRTPINYEQLLDLSSAVGLTANTYDDATYAIVQAQDQDVRWRDDGTVPNAGTGMVLAAGQSMAYFGDLSAIKFVETAASAKLNVSYYRGIA